MAKPKLTPRQRLITKAIKSLEEEKAQAIKDHEILLQSLNLQICLLQNDCDHKYLDKTAKCKICGILNKDT